MKCHIVIVAVKYLPSGIVFVFLHFCISDSYARARCINNRNIGDDDEVVWRKYFDEAFYHIYIKSKERPICIVFHSSMMSHILPHQSQALQHYLSVNERGISRSNL